MADELNHIKSELHQWYDSYLLVLKRRRQLEQWIDQTDYSMAHIFGELPSRIRVAWENTQ